MAFLDTNGPLNDGSVIEEVNDVDFAVEDPTLSWMNIAEKSRIVGCANALGNLLVKDCEEVNAHWFRNMQTSQTETDNQISIEDVGKQFNVVGFSFNGS